MPRMLHRKSMLRVWQRFKFFAGLLIAGTIFIVLWYGMLIYSEKYVKTEKEKPVEEGTFVVPSDLHESALDFSKGDKSATDLTLNGDEFPVEEEDSAATDTIPLPVTPDKPSIADKPVLPEDTSAVDKPDLAEDGDLSNKGKVVFKEDKKEDEGKPKVEDIPEPPEEPLAEMTGIGAEVASTDINTQMRRLGVTKSDPVFLRIIKSDYLLELWMRPRSSESYVLVKKYPVLAISGKIGPKQKQGDMQAPEGFYRVFASSLNPNSTYHLSFNIGYPNAWDKLNNRTGNYIMVHGSDVSAGCFAIGDKGVEELYSIVESYVKAPDGKVGIPVHVYPFALTEKRLAAAKKHEHYAFWCFLKEAWDWTEKRKSPPPVRIAPQGMFLDGKALLVKGVAKRQVYIAAQTQPQ